MKNCKIPIFARLHVVLKLNIILIKGDVLERQSRVPFFSFLLMLVGTTVTKEEE